MKGLLFLPPTPLLPHHTGISKCARRPRTAIVSSSAPQDANSEPDWLRQIANDLAPDSTEEPVRAAPQWTYPDGNPADIDSESNPWDAWTDVREADEERFVQRDPKAETDFWRSAAREVAPGPDIDTSGVKGKARERSDETVEGRERSEDAAGPTKSNAWALWNEALRNEAAQELKQRDPKAETDFWRSTARELSSSEPVNPAEELSETLEEANSEDVWRMARGVTGEVSDLQDRLRSELERYNPDENTDQYRDIARELVGPPDDPLDTEPKRVDAESGSGWNPDVDWKRFDDINREREADAQRGVREAAEREQTWTSCS